MAALLAKYDLAAGQRLAALMPKALGNVGSRQLEQYGVPTTAHESWRYTNLAATLSRDFVLASERLDVVVPPPLWPDADRVVFVSGYYHPGLSSIGALPPGMKLGVAGCLASQKELEQPGRFTALNHMLQKRGFGLSLSDGVVAPRPIEVLFVDGVGPAELGATRLHITLGAGARAVILERHESLSAHEGLSDYTSQIILAKGARLRHLRLQNSAIAATHLARGWVTVAGDATYEAHSLVTGAALSRHEVDIGLNAVGARATLAGAVALAGGQHGDVTTRITHAAPATTATESYRYALAEAAQGVFQGLITVEKGASQADGRMTAKTLLLSDKAVINAKPELRIFHDAVSCAHGCTVGKLDPLSLFYLRSRGLDEVSARRLLVRSFLAEMLGEEEVLLQALDQRLEAL